MGDKTHDLLGSFGWQNTRQSLGERSENIGISKTIQPWFEGVIFQGNLCPKRRIQTENEESQKTCETLQIIGTVPDLGWYHRATLPFKIGLHVGWGTKPQEHNPTTFHRLVTSKHPDFEMWELQESLIGEKDHERLRKVHQNQREKTTCAISLHPASLKIQVKVGL